MEKKKKYNPFLNYLQGDLNNKNNIKDVEKYSRKLGKGLTGSDIIVHGKWQYQFEPKGRKIRRDDPEEIWYEYADKIKKG